MKTLTYTIKPLLALTISLLAVCSTTAIASGQGTITTTFHNDCTGNRNIEINATLMMDSGVQFNLNIPEVYVDPLKTLSLKCGEKKTTTLLYDMPYSDYQIHMLLVQTSYFDNRMKAQADVSWKNYSWPANGTNCSITYTGMSSLIVDVSCQKN